LGGKGLDLEVLGLEGLGLGLGLVVVEGELGGEFVQGEVLLAVGLLALLGVLLLEAERGLQLGFHLVVLSARTFQLLGGILQQGLQVSYHSVFQLTGLLVLVHLLVLQEVLAGSETQLLALRGQGLTLLLGK
jgi:hypothetical protein